MIRSIEQAPAAAAPPFSRPCRYGIADVERHLGVAYTPAQREALRVLPFPDEAIHACAASHVLFPGYPLSLLDLCGRHPDLFDARACAGLLTGRHPFARAPVPLRWHLLRTGPVLASHGRTWPEQCALLGPDDEPAGAAVIAFAAALHFRVTGLRLFRHGYVRTADLGADGDPVVAGGFDDAGLDISDDWGFPGLRLHMLGLASARKAP